MYYHYNFVVEGHEDRFKNLISIYGDKCDEKEEGFLYVVSTLDNNVYKDCLNGGINLKERLCSDNFNYYLESFGDVIDNILDDKLNLESFSELFEEYQDSVIEYSKNRLMSNCNNRKNAYYDFARHKLDSFEDRLNSLIEYELDDCNNKASLVFLAYILSSDASGVVGCPIANVTHISFSYEDLKKYMLIYERIIGANLEGYYDGDEDELLAPYSLDNKIDDCPDYDEIEYAKSIYLRNNSLLHEHPSIYYLADFMNLGTVEFVSNCDQYDDEDNCTNGCNSLYLSSSACIDSIGADPGFGNKKFIKDVITALEMIKKFSHNNWNIE